MPEMQRPRSTDFQLTCEKRSSRDVGRRNGDYRRQSQHPEKQVRVTAPPVLCHYAFLFSDTCSLSRSLVVFSSIKHQALYSPEPLSDLFVCEPTFDVCANLLRVATSRTARFSPYASANAQRHRCYQMRQPRSGANLVPALTNFAPL